MSFLSTVAASAVAVRAVEAVARPVAAASDSFLDLLSGTDAATIAPPADTGGAADLLERRSALVERLRELVASLAGQSPSGAEPAEVTLELSPLGNVYIDSDMPWRGPLEQAIEDDPSLLAALRQWFTDSGQRTLKADLSPSPPL